MPSPDVGGCISLCHLVYSYLGEDCVEKWVSTRFFVVTGKMGGLSLR